MISFKQFITEALDSSYPVVYKANTPQHVHYTFTDSDGNKFSVGMYRMNIAGKVYTEVAFETEIKSGGTYTQPTGATKNALKVYSTVGKQLRDYIKVNPVDIISFSAASSRTYKIYDKLAKKIAEELHGKIVKPNMREGTWEIHL